MRRRRCTFLAVLTALATQACTKTSCPDGAVYFAPGSFEMGSSSQDNAFFDERPPHRVTLTRGFCLDRTEVTRKAFRECEAKGRCPTDRRPVSEYNPQRPVDYVDWQQAVDYCAFRGGRLPTEAEWEYAARGPEGRLYPWGNEPPTPEHWQVRPKGETTTICDVGKHPKGRTPQGLEDMSGNLSEWVSDFCGPYTPGPVTDPKGPPKSLKPDFPRCRIARGGAWSHEFDKYAQATVRTFGHDSLGDYSKGIRCAYEPR